MDKSKPVMKDGSLSGNAAVGFYLLDQAGIDKTKVKQEEWGILWGCLFQYRSNAKRALTVKDIDAIAQNEFKVPSGSSARAVAAYGALSNVLDNLYTSYPVEGS